MARALSEENLLSNPNFLGAVSALYSQDKQSCAQRYSMLTTNLSGKVRFFSSPGRAEIVGNHTDHNHGFVIAASIDMDVVAAVVPTTDDKITVNSVGYPAFTVDINDTAPLQENYGTSPALVLGVVKGFLDKGYKVGGFVANTHSNIFKGAGVSSSAAFELLICEILSVLYNGGKVGFVDKALISQFAENVYFGKPSGLMDQLTISKGGVSFMDFANPNMPKLESIDWSFDDVNIVIINGGGDHCDLTSEYTAIRQEMGQVAAYFGKNVLRDVDACDFIQELPDLVQRLSGRAILRALHFFEENRRVIKAKDALEKCDKTKFLDIINASGDSSYKLLQNCYAPNDTAQRIPLALALTSQNKNVLAHRVHGGGFAGTILAFVAKEDCAAFERYISRIFGKDNVFTLSIRKFGAIEVEV